MTILSTPSRESQTKTCCWSFVADISLKWWLSVNGWSATSSRFGATMTSDSAGWGAPPSGDVPPAVVPTGTGAGDGIRHEVPSSTLTGLLCEQYGAGVFAPGMDIPSRRRCLDQI